MQYQEYLLRFQDHSFSCQPIWNYLCRLIQMNNVYQAWLTRFILSCDTVRSKSLRPYRKSYHSEVWGQYGLYCFWKKFPMLTSRTIKTIVLLNILCKQICFFGFRINMLLFCNNIPSFFTVIHLMLVFKVLIFPKNYNQTVPNLLIGSSFDITVI